MAVVDTVGAGDLFTSGCLFALLSGASLQACTLCGCAAGSAAVQTAGAELAAEALQQLRDTIRGILAANSASKRVPEDARAADGVPASAR